MTHEGSNNIANSSNAPYVIATIITVSISLTIIILYNDAYDAISAYGELIGASFTAITFIWIIRQLMFLQIQIDMQSKEYNSNNKLRLSQIYTDAIQSLSYLDKFYKIKLNDIAGKICKIADFNQYNEPKVEDAFYYIRLLDSDGDLHTKILERTHKTMSIIIYDYINEFKQIYKNYTAQRSEICLEMPDWISKEPDQMLYKANESLKDY